LVAPYAPPGIAISPVRGSFEGGDENKRDVIIWSYMPTPNATAVGPGRTFAFQLTSDYSDGGSTADFNVKVLSPNSTWQSTTAPLIVAKGLSMYWSVSRSQLRAWIPTPNATNGTADGSFDQDRTHSVEFDRGNPSFLAPFVKPIVDDASTPKVLCVGAASEEFVCLHADNLTTIWSETTNSLIKTEARFSTNGDRVYFIEEDGILHAINTTSGKEIFNDSLEDPVSSNFDLSIDGAFLYYGDETGNVFALQLADSTLPPVMPATRAPTEAPTRAPAEAPARAPSSPTQFPVSLPPTTTVTTTSDALQMVVISMIAATSGVAFVLCL
jgi:outer membrane protein assembly factor BamB